MELIGLTEEEGKLGQSRTTGSGFCLCSVVGISTSVPSNLSSKSTDK